MKSIILQKEIINDEYTEFVYKNFDIQNKYETKVEIPFNIDLEGEWNLGVIYGGSGSGKSTILKNIGEIKTPLFDNSKSLISNFNFISPNEASFLLSSIGLASIPTWLRPYDCLSNGEKYRAELAMLISKSKDGEIILVDEYTSLVDRDVAKAMSFAMQKFIRKTNKKIILASCHSDIIEWLTPDWYYSAEKGQVERPDLLRQSRPQIELEIFRCKYDAWHLFKQYHYLTADLNKTAKCYLATWNDKPVAINCVLPMPNGNYKNAVRGSRLVVLPEYQGLGLGIKLSEYIAGLYKKAGYRYFTKTIHPATGNYRNHSSNWKPTAKNGKIRNDNMDSQKEQKHWEAFKRQSFCHEYIGIESEGDINMLNSIDHFR